MKTRTRAKLAKQRGLLSTKHNSPGVTEAVSKSTKYPQHIDPQFQSQLYQKEAHQNAKPKHDPDYGHEPVVVLLQHKQYSGFNLLHFVSLIIGVIIFMWFILLCSQIKTNYDLEHSNFLFEQSLCQEKYKTYWCAEQEYPDMANECTNWLKCINTPAHLNIDKVEILTSALFSGPVKLIFNFGLLVLLLIQLNK